MSKKIAAPDFGKYNKVYEVLKSRTDEQIIKGFDLCRQLNGRYWNDLPSEVEAMNDAEQDAWVFGKYPLAKDTDTVTEMYFSIAAARFPKAYHKFFWDFGNWNVSLGYYVNEIKKQEENENV